MEFKNRIKSILQSMPVGRIYLVHKMWPVNNEGSVITCQADFGKSEYAYTYMEGLLDEVTPDRVISIHDMGYPYILFEGKDKVCNICVFFSDMSMADAYANGKLNL